MKKRSILLAFALLFTIGKLLAQRTIQGTITDESSSPLIGASVLAEGTTVGTVTDIDGNFELRIPEGVANLIVSYTGFATATVELGTSNIVDITLEETAIGLQDVVVIGYGEQSERYNVQSISRIENEALANVPVVSPQELLQGQAAGVQLTNTSGVLGAATAIRIRGVASLNAGGQPLIVVDGVPLNDGDYSNTLGATALNPLQDINPNDIESMSVLKDAAAAAIYGSRGSNGVILITTKKGKAGTNNVNFNYYTGWSEPTDVFDMMDADQNRQYRVDALGADPATLPEGAFDWQDAVLQTGRINNYDASISGGSDKTQYYLGGVFSEQSNYVIGNELDRMSGRLNFKHTVSDKFRFGANISVSRVLNDRISSDNSTFAPLTSAYLQQPWVSPFDDDGQLRNTGFIANVIAIEQRSIRNLISRRTTGNVYAMYDILPGLTFRTDFGIDEIQTEETTRDPEIVSPGGYGFREINRDNKWLTTNTLRFEKEVGSSYFSIDGILAYETARLENTTVEGSDFAADNLRNVASAATPTTTFASRTEWALFTQILRANYRLQDKYIIEGSVRRDGSSRFGTDNKYGVFWAASAGWLLSEESFMDNVGFINYLKLSASYGVSGNDRIGNFASLGLYQSGVDSDYNGMPGLRPTQAANPDLKWEETAQLDIGVSTQMFNSRVGLDVNFYIKNTTDLLLDFNLPEVLGISDITRNAGEMRNTGVDLNIRTTNVQRGDFEWTTNLNVGWVENEILSLPGASVDADGNEFIIGTASQRAIVGHSANTFFLVRYNGINDTGDAEWLDLEGNPTTTYSSANRVIVGSAIPDFTGGITNSLRYKDLDFSFFFNFVYGNEIMLDELRFTENTNAPFNISTRLLDFWTPQNTGGVVPSPESSTFPLYGQRSTNQLLDGSFLRLRNITLGYTLRGNALNTNFFNTIRAYVMGQNLLTFTNSDFRGQDPEVNDGGAGSNLNQGESFFTPPQARTITIGINASF
ncbi:MAG: TonB-dependent receptor [Bacteroidota bacterium]